MTTDKKTKAGETIGEYDGTNYLLFIQFSKDNYVSLIASTYKEEGILNAIREDTFGDEEYTTYTMVER